MPSTGVNVPCTDEGVDDAAQQLDADSGSQERTCNVRTGSRTKTVLTDNAGKVDVTVPRDRAGTFEPVIVPKHHRSVQALEKDLRDWIIAWNQNPKLFIWKNRKPDPRVHRTTTTTS